MISEKGLSIRNFGYQRNGLCRDAFATPGKPEMLGSGSLYTYAVDIDTQICGNVRSHGIYIGAHLRRLRNNSDIHIAGDKSFIGKDRHHTPEQHARVGAAPALVGVGEVQAYVAKSRSPKEGIAECMQGDISVAVTQQTFPVWYIHSTDNAAPAFDKAVNIKSVSDPEGIHQRPVPNRSLSPSISNVSEKRRV